MEPQIFGTSYTKVSAPDAPRSHRQASRRAPRHLTPIGHAANKLLSSPPHVPESELSQPKMSVSLCRRRLGKQAIHTGKFVSCPVAMSVPTRAQQSSDPVTGSADDTSNLSLNNISESPRRMRDHLACTQQRDLQASDSFSCAHASGFAQAEACCRAKVCIAPIKRQQNLRLPSGRRKTQDTECLQQVPVLEPFGRSVGSRSCFRDGVDVVLPAADCSALAEFIESCPVKSAPEICKKLVHCSEKSAKLVVGRRLRCVR